MSLPTRRLMLGLALVCAARPSFAVGQAPARIASIGGTVTEILYALGIEDRIAAIDATSLYPPQALATKPNVGYFRQLSAEGLLSQRPDLVLAVEGAGPPDALALVREAGTRLVMVPEDPTEAGVGLRIMTIARAVDREQQGRALADAAARRFADVATLRSRITRPTRALFILSLQNGRAMVGGRGTAADGMLALAGATNVASDIQGFRPMTNEAIAAAQPEAIVMMDVGPGGKPPADLFDNAGLAQTPAGRDRRLVAMNGLLLLGFGPRTPEAARELLLALHPGTRTE